jgi:hypothetical protein
MYRWNVFNTYDNPTFSWLFANSAAVFGGVTPLGWSEGSATAESLTADKDLQRSMLTQKGYPGRNALVLSDTRVQHSTQDGKLVVILFRVKNTTAQPIVWQPHFWYSANGAWGEVASVALNGVNVYTDNTPSSGTLGTPSLPIPPNRTSTVVFVSGSGIAQFFGDSNHYYRSTVAGFIDNSLALPTGLEFADDLDTATGGYDR